jgi:hypothetical protein
MGATPVAIPISMGTDMTTVAATPHPKPRQRRAEAEEVLAESVVALAASVIVEKEVV